MPKVLSQDQVNFYNEQGYLFPLPCISPAEGAAMWEDLQKFERDEGISPGRFNMKGHLCFRRSYDLAHNDSLLDAVEDILGPDILLFAARFWIKKGGDGNFVTWHQDSAYFGVEPHDVLTAWVALTDASTENGCMRVLRGSHRGPAHQHVETFDEKNLLARGQMIEGLDDSRAIDMPLKAGQMSLHHERLVHGSLANRTNGPRVGVAFFFIPTYARSTIGRRTAMLVRGVDQHGHWDVDPVPQQDRDPEIIAHVRASSERYVDPTYRQEADAS